MSRSRYGVTGLAGTACTRRRLPDWLGRGTDASVADGMGTPAGQGWCRPRDDGALTRTGVEVTSADTPLAHPTGEPPRSRRPSDIGYRTVTHGSPFDIRY